MELASKADIEKISLEILKHSKALDVFPTPVDQIIKFTELKLDKDIDLLNIQPSFLEKFSQSAQKKLIDAFDKIRGILDRREKIIYLDPRQSGTRLNWVKLHEVGHDVLPWQNEILQFLEDDETLDPYILEEFESEANLFASLTLFQHDRFDNEMSKLGLDIKSLMHLAKTFGASNHATFRTYVERSNKRCALLVLKDVSGTDASPECFKRNFFMSQSFKETFGSIEFPDRFGYKWEFTKLYWHRRRFCQSEAITLPTDNGETQFTFDFFNNTYNAFVFIYPIGEVNKTRTKIILSA